MRAGLDWELCTLGDPLADLGLLIVYWVDPGADMPTVLTGTATHAPGFPTHSEVAERYVEARAPTASTVRSPRSSSPSSTKNAVAAARSSATMPRWRMRSSPLRSTERDDGPGMDSLI